MPPTVLALHGNGGGAFRFDRLRLHLGDLDLVAVDLPGFGGRPAPARPVTLDHLATAVRHELDQLDRPTVVLGHGIGGSIALTALQEPHPNAVGLILHAPVGPRLDSRWFPRLMQPMIVRRGIQWAISSLPARLIGRALLFRDTDVPREWIDRFLGEYRRTEAFADMFDLLTAEWYDGLEPLELPAALLWGEGDRVLAHGHSDDLVALVPGAERIVVPGWGHFPMIEQPADYVARIGEIANSLDPSS